MQSLVLEPAKEAVKDGVSPFKGAGKLDNEVYWVGPFTYGPCFFALHGPLQLIFILLAVASLALLVIEYRRSEEFDWLRTLSGALFILVCFYLVYLGKAIYVLKAFRQEIGHFKQLNRQLRGEVGKFEKENAEYENQNKEHERLNQELSEQVNGLGHVEEKLGEIATDCNGSVQEARDLLGKLDRFLKLDTLNSVFQFFDRSDRNKNGMVDSSEASLFVDSLSVLWKHLPRFRPERLKEEIKVQGGMSMEQVHKLVDLMISQEEGKEEEELSMTGKLQLVFAKEQAEAAHAEEKVDAPGSCPGAVVVDP